jgi:hypothetical protein
VAAAGWLHLLFDKADMAVWVADAERFIFVVQHGNFRVDFKTGDLLKPEGTPARIIATGQRVARLVPPHVYGVSCKSIGFPLPGGAIGVSFSVDHEEAVQRDLSSLQTLSGAINTAGRSIAGNAQALQGFMERVGHDLNEATKQLTAIDAIGALIASVAEETRYISLNALIEAHRVEGGSTFVVVANEMKELSAKTRASVQQVSVTLESLQKRFGDLSAAVASARTHVNEQSSATQAISSELDQVSESIRRIEALARQL